MVKPCIDIILATYNGARYIEQQIRSIQQCDHYFYLVARIIVVDDGSVDDTRAIVCNLQNSDSKIEWHINKNGKQGAKENFSYALGLAQSEYIMLCDQDDFWHKDKILLSYQALIALQANNQPQLVFTDKVVVDDLLNVICESFFKYRKIPINWHESTERLLQMNVASGCTMMFNQALLRQAMPIPTQAFMHDWWLILVAQLSGNVVFINRATIKYRQHSKNTIGAKDYSLLYLVRNFSEHLEKFERNFWRAVEQAETITSLFNNEPDVDVPFSHFRKLGYWRRLGYFFQGRVCQSNWKSQLALFLILLKGTSYTKLNSHKS
ncbi:glycosyltransferase family 2 protein [Vibrio atypicus]|uniref:glycosyltransferase family 2 protein n=1 Tax=Vibrio atypicus TaxID=558271 RepID=UPI0013576717|nr:glycosyltransferase family 2 protein [Vibrio atypicus]